MITIISFHLHGIDLSDSGISELERPLRDSLKTAILKKFFHVPFPLTEDTSFLQELIDKSNFGTLKVTANTLLNSTTIAIGFLRLDSSLPQLKHQLEDNSFHLSDGTDILRSGITKPSILRIVLRFMTEVSMPSLSHQEETLL